MFSGLFRISGFLFLGCVILVLAVEIPDSQQRKIRAPIVDAAVLKQIANDEPCVKELLNEDLRKDPTRPIIVGAIIESRKKCEKMAIINSQLNAIK